jgi:hypothetical protein
MTKIDFKKELKQFYQASAKQVVEVKVPPFNYLMVDGVGYPNTSPAYAQAVEALFSVAYTAKFMLKKAAPSVDYAVMPLEGLWWMDDMARFSTADKSQWQWTMMILQPPLVSRATINAAIDTVQTKKGLAGLERLRFTPFAEGRCAQLLHVGPFSEEGPTIERLHQFIDARATRTGKHHEIYLSDIRKADPKNWKTILRQPMQ